MYAFHSEQHTSVLVLMNPLNSEKACGEEHKINVVNFLKLLEVK